MTRGGFEEVHAFLDGLNLPVGDSFWLFDPSGGDMGLFTHDVDHPGPQHHWLLDRLNDGTIDVIHSTGSFGERFNRGYRPDRGQLEGALAYVAEHARVPCIWTNHGDRYNTQNIGGRLPLDHHRGDIPGDPAYSLDLLQSYGVTYFWLDRLVVRDAKRPFRVTSREVCRDGREIVTFTRFLSPGIAWSPNGQNFDSQLSEDEIGWLSANEQDAVFYTHWGSHHQSQFAFSPDGPALTAESRRAIERFAGDLPHRGATLMRLEPLLASSNQTPPLHDVQRIGKIIVQTEYGNADQFYFNQYHRHGIDFFRQRVGGLGVSGGRALDAGCGVGQWSYALQAHFTRVHGIEINGRAVDYLAQIMRALDWSSGPLFTRGSIDALPYRDALFDFIVCYGVLFSAPVRRGLQEFKRVLAPGGRVFLSMNGDGWYEQLCDERFGDRELDEVLPFAEPLWRALVARVGPRQFDAACLGTLRRRPDSFWTDVSAVRETFIEIFESPVIDLRRLLAGYSNRVIRLLARLTQRHQAGLAGRHPRRTWAADVLSRLRGRSLAVSVDECFPTSGPGSFNRAFMPDEFRVLAGLVGLKVLSHGPDAALSNGAVQPIYSPDFQGHAGVWECMIADRS